MRKSIACCFAIAAAFGWLTAIPPATFANLVANGGFESGPTMPPSGEMQLPAGSTAMTGWQVTRAPVNLVLDVYWESAEGVRSLALNATSTAGGVTQTFATVPGVAYKVDFMISGEPFTTPTLKRLRVTAAGQQADFSFDSANNWHWAMGWTPCTWSFTANSPATAIEFFSLMTSASSPLIDDVKVDLVTTDVAERAPALALSLSSPTPARDAVNIAFSLPEAGRALLVVADVAGRRIATVADGSFSPGPHPARWSAAGAPPGVYTVTLRAGERTLARRFVLLR